MKDIFIWIFAITITLPILKFLNFTIVASWSWWIILAPFYGTFLISAGIMVIDKIRGKNE